jgi:ubiquitin conjugation factor E4 B
MKDPVLLPTSHKMVDRMYIHKHLLNDERDPFNRKPLKLSELQDQPKLRQEISEWKLKRL